MGPTGGHEASACWPLRQDYSAIIDLVETLQALPTCDVAEQHNVCFHYTFALNRVGWQGKAQVMATWGHGSLPCKSCGLQSMTVQEFADQDHAGVKSSYDSVSAAQGGVGWWC